MSVYILTFVATFCLFVGVISYLTQTKITIQYCLIGIGFGIFGAAIVGVSYDISKNDLKQQTIQKECVDAKN